MHGLLHISKEVYHRFMNIKVMYKLMLGFIVVVLIPTMILESAFYNQNYSATVNQYIQNEKNSLEIAQKNLGIQLKGVEEAANFLNSSSGLISFLEGDYDSASQEVVNYLLEIEPLLSYIMYADGAIRKITFYSQRDFEIHWDERLITVEELPFFNNPQISRTDLAKGIWYKVPGDPQTVSFYQSIHSDVYSQVIAMVQIDVSLVALMENFSVLTGDIYLHFANETVPLAFSGQQLFYRSKEEFAEALREDEQFAVCETYVGAMGLTVYQKLDLQSTLDYNGDNLLLILILLALFLLVGYYLIATSIIKRIVRLQKHISNMDADNLRPMEEVPYQDEIGQLTATYNNMIERINDLLFQIYHTELEMKDARFYALQAQIEPHFLYNILENIHMSAEAAGDEQTAEMVVSLGKLMRYNLNGDTGLVSLMEELTHARNYLDLHKIRMGSELSVEIAVFTDIDDVKCPRFTLQPIMENALKHAVISNQPLHITVTVKDRREEESEGDVVVEIRDDGAGISVQDLLQIQNSLKDTTYIKDAHIGLNNINNRLQAFFGSEYSLQIDSVPGEGTTVVILLMRSK